MAGLLLTEGANPTLRSDDDQGLWGYFQIGLENLQLSAFEMERKLHYESCLNV